MPRSLSACSQGWLITPFELSARRRQAYWLSSADGPPLRLCSNGSMALLLDVREARVSVCPCSSTSGKMATGSSRSGWLTATVLTGLAASLAAGLNVGPDGAATPDTVRLTDATGAGLSARRVGLCNWFNIRRLRPCRPACGTATGTSGSRRMAACLNGVDTRFRK